MVKIETVPSLRLATSAKRARRIDRDAGRRRARLDGRDHRRRLGFQIDDRDLIVGCGLFRIGRVDLDGASHQRDSFRRGKSRRFAAGRRRSSAPSTSPIIFGGLDADVDDRDGVGGRIVGNRCSCRRPLTTLLSLADTAICARRSDVKQRQCEQARTASFAAPARWRFMMSPPARMSLMQRGKRAEPRAGRAARLTPNRGESFRCLRARPPPAAAWRGRRAPS